MRGVLPDPGGVLLVAFGVMCGVAALAGGFYDLSQWGWAAVAMLAALLVLLVVRPLPRGRASALALAGLLLLAVWSLASRAWTPSPGTALVDADRWMLYAATLAVLLLLIRGARDAKLLLGACTAAVVAVALYLMIRMGVGDGASLFLGGRLQEPIGYINGQAGFLLLGFWPLIAVAERVQRTVWAPLALGTASLLAGLIVLTDSRGAEVAFTVSALVVLVMVPGRRVRAWTLLTVLVAMLAIGGPLRHVHSSGGLAASDAIRRAAGLILLAAICVGLVWWAVGSITAALERRSPAAGPARARLASALLGVVAVVALVVTAASAGTIADRVDAEYHAFTRLRESGRHIQFFSGGGTRYDYWRIAMREFRDEPLRGQGAGGYPVGYFRDRRTTEDVQQPHSIEFQTLAELGLVGACALALFMGAVLFALGRLSRAGRDDPTQRVIAVAAGGTFLAWLAHTSVDWLHRIPGVTGIALAAAAVIVSSPRQGAGGADGPPRHRGQHALLGLALAYGVVAFAAVEVARPALALHHRSQARKALDADPGRALASANEALELNEDDVSAYYLEAAAYARFNRYANARSALLRGLRREPHNFVTWALLGDLAYRHGDLAQARDAYAHAVALNPRDPALSRRLQEAWARVRGAR